MGHRQLFPLKITQLNIENVLQPKLDFYLIFCTCHDVKIFEYLCQKVLVHLLFLL